MQVCRLIVDQTPRPGALQMAIDESLLRSAAEDHLASLRFYRWHPRALSLGYFQPYSQRDQHAASQECDCVRRTSGGGAIVHDLELTYCYATPLNSLPHNTSTSSRARAESLYHAFHETLIEILNNWGWRASLVPATDPSLESRFLCFQRRAAGDVIVAGYKVTGSAQRRWKNALVQHGSVLLRHSLATPELPGLLDLTSHHSDVAASDASQLWYRLAETWPAKLAERIKFDLMPANLADKETELAEAIQVAKFSAPSWTQKR